MRKTLIPHLAVAARQTELRNQTVIAYKVWTLPSFVGYWSDSGNWSNNTKPSGGSNVLFGPYQSVCLINEDTPSLGGFRVRDDYTQYISDSNKTISTTGYFTYYGQDHITIDRATVNVGKDVRLAGDGNIFWDRCVWNISGNFDQRDLNTPVDNYSTINMLGSGVTIYSEDELNILNIYSMTTTSGNIIIEGQLNISGELVIPTGLEVINRGTNADVSIYGTTSGPGSLVLEDQGSIIRQNGYIGNDYLIIRNGQGQVLPAAIYSAKNIIIESNGNINSFVFGTGHYHFDTDLTIRSTGGGSLEINNKFNAATVHFNRDLTIQSGSFSSVIWKTGDGSIIFGQSTSIGKAFGKYGSRQGGINTVEDVRGLAMSHKNKINGEPLVWALNSGDLNLAGSGVGVQVFTQAGHTVGYFIATSAPAASGFGDVCIGRIPSSATERIFIGDIADPNANRPIIRIYRAVEPTITGYNFYNDSIPVTYSFQYPLTPTGESGGRARDSRALGMHYSSSDIYIISHRTATPQLFFIEGANSYVGTQTLGYSGTLQIESGVVGMDISRDGKEVLVKTWQNLYHYRVTGNNTICQTLTGTIPTRILDYQPGFQEHGVAWGSGKYSNDTVYTLETFSEELHDPILKAPLWLYRKKNEISPNGLLLDTVRIEASGYEKVLASDLVTNNFILLSGVLNPSGNDVISKSGFYAGPNSNFDNNGLVGSRLASSGDFILVGSNTNLFNLLPDSGNAGWIINAYGNNRAYFANVRSSNASTGNPIYAFVSNDYGTNTNWIFGGGAPVSGAINIYVSGEDGVTNANGFMPISIFGRQGVSSGNLFLSITGGTPGSLYGSIELYTSGGIKGSATGGIPVYLCNSGVEGSLPIWISGGGILAGSTPLGGVLYLTIANSGSSGSLPIYLLGGGNATGSIPLSIMGGSGISGGLPITLLSYGSTNNVKIPVFIHGRHASPG